MSVDNSKMKKVLEQLNSWCTKYYPQVQSVYDDCAGYTLQQLVYYLLGVVKNCVDQVVENSDAFNALETEFKDLKSFVVNYFENLDVQEEINNKLDEMFNSGELNVLLNLFVPYATPEMYGAIGDGVSDDTDAFQKAVNFGNVIARNKYKISSTILISKSSTISGNGTLVDESDDELFMCENVNGVTISNLTIESKSDYIGTKNQLYFKGCNNIILDKLTITNTNASVCILFDASNNCNVIDTVLHNYYEYGIRCINECSNITIEKCLIENCLSIETPNYAISLYGVFGESVTTKATNLVAKNCHIKNFKWHAIDAHGGLNVFIIDNVIECGNNEPYIAINVSDRRSQCDGVTISDNKIIGNNSATGYCISVAIVNNGIVSGNYIKNWDKDEATPANTSGHFYSNGGVNILFINNICIGVKKNTFWLVGTNIKIINNIFRYNIGIYIDSGFILNGNGELAIIENTFIGLKESGKINNNNTSNDCINIVKDNIVTYSDGRNSNVLTTSDSVCVENSKYNDSDIDNLIYGCVGMIISGKPNDDGTISIYVCTTQHTPSRNATWYKINK